MDAPNSLAPPCRHFSRYRLRAEPAQSYIQVQRIEGVIFQTKNDATIKRYQLAVTAEDPGASDNNWATAPSCAIEPTSTKADRIRTALLSFVVKLSEWSP